jgi:hypothetical protein
MGRRKKENMEETPCMLPAKTPEAMESEMIDSAMRLAYRQMQEGTASAQVITHFLKLGTTKANLEREKIALENELLKAKTDACKSNERIEELYKDAIKAFQSYIPGSEEHDSDL